MTGTNHADPGADADADAAPMLTEPQLAQLRQRLLAERSRLLQHESAFAPVRASEERAADPSDEAEANLMQHEALARAAHDRPLLTDIDRALAKFEAGTYGLSELSGEPIGFGRLAAIPWARFSAAEQEDLERSQKQGLS
jgi:DnaK suppressor protein